MSPLQLPGGVVLLAAPWEIAVAVALAAAAWLVAWLLERRRARPRRALRLGLLALALAAAVVLAARPAQPRLASGSTASVLTPGASARDLAAALSSGEPVWAVPPRPGEPAPPPGAPLLPDAAALVRNHPEVTRLRVFGHGLSPAEWAAVALPVVAGEPPPLPAGFRNAGWDRRIVLGESLTVRGRVVTGAAGATVRLEGAGVAAVARLAAGDATFGLAGVPRGAGHHLMTLTLTGPDGVLLEEETLDVVVTPPSLPAVLWLEDAPSLESRELAHWLPAAGGAFAVRSRLSRGIEREHLAGLPAGLRLGSLTPSLLARFDLVVADGGALAGLGTADRAALAAAVRSQGLGLLVLPEESAGGTVEALGVRFTLRSAGGGSSPVPLAWTAAPGAPELRLPSRSLAASPGQVALVTDSTAAARAAWQPAGLGAVAVSVVDGTWRWVREGNAAAHRGFWAALLRELARPAPTRPRWTAPATPVLVDRPLEVALAAPPREPTVAVVGPRGEIVRPGLRRVAAGGAPSWTTTLWPRDSGWHRVGDAEAALGFWAAPAGAWPTLRLAERQDATAARLRAAAATAAAPNRVAAPPLPLPRWPWFALFVGALGALWLLEAWSARAGGGVTAMQAQAEERRSAA
jgi:hypothetical protein